MNSLAKILESEYGCSVCSAPVEAIEWATDKIVDTEQAKKELKKVNSIRTKYGIIPCRVPYGHRLF